MSENDKQAEYLDGVEAYSRQIEKAKKENLLKNPPDFGTPEWEAYLDALPLDRCIIPKKQMQKYIDDAAKRMPYSSSEKVFRSAKRKAESRGWLVFEDKVK